MKSVWIIFAIIGITSVVGWNVFYPSATWRYKMTVTVETPEGIKTGYAVREVNVQLTPRVLPEVRGIEYSIKGEAVAVDLGDRGVLFALLSSETVWDHAEYLVPRSFPANHYKDIPGGSRGRKHVRFYQDLAKTKNKATLKFDEYPMFVRFKDIADPKTVEKVDATNLVASFGEGVTLQNIQIEMTSEEVTVGMAKLLPWLPNRRYVTGYLGSTADDILNDPTQTYLNGSEFSQGE